MDITLGAIISWVIVGALAGSIVGRIMKGSKTGYGIWKNMLIGLVGAVIGWFLFNLLKVDFGLSEIRITAADMISGIIGAFIFLAILALVGKAKK